MHSTARDQRRLAAILAADVVGYSHMVALDEAGALAALRRLRGAVLEPAIAAHGGRLFKTMGDGYLAEFASTVEALRCAMEIQAKLAEDPPEAPRLRIGLHVGDVVVEGEDLLGDGVNIAARLQPLAEPGGIALSARVREDTAGRIALAALEDLGSPELKNIPVPVWVFRLPSSDAAQPGAAEPTGTAQPHAAEPTGAPRLAVLDRPALVVLPFANLSGDAEQEYFADGITDELITQLSRARWFYVIARNSAFAYKGRRVDIRQIGRDLGVRYILEGSVRRAGTRVRIGVQLAEAETRRQIWTERFDGTLDDLFDLEDRVAAAVSGAIEPTLQSAEVRRAQTKPTGSLTAYDLYLRAVPHHLAATPEGTAEALRLLRLAIAEDPGFSLGKALAAFCHTNAKGQGWTDSFDPTEGIALAREALAEHGDHPTTLRYAALAIALLAGDLEAGMAAIERARALSPNSGQVSGVAGWLHNYCCQPDAATDCFDRAIRLSPLDSEMHYLLSGMAMARLIARDYAAALVWSRRSIAHAPRWLLGFRTLIAAHWHLGETEEARAAAVRLLDIGPQHRISIALAKFSDPAFVQAMVGALRGAGIPD